MGTGERRDIDKHEPGDPGDGGLPDDSGAARGMLHLEPKARQSHDDGAHLNHTVHNRAGNIRGPGSTYVALGDSWSHGTHCGGCRTFAGRYGDGLPRIAGRPVTFADQTKNGGGTDSVLSDIRSDGSLRHVIESADIIMIATGLNDLVVDRAVDRLRAGTCGGTDGADCLRAAGAAWRSNFAAIMVEISSLRHAKPTALRLVVEPNVFLSDPSLVKDSGLPADFPLKGGALTISLLRDALCDTARKHHAICVDAGRILNGPKLDQPRDENTPAAHQAVADALLATGLPELD